MNASQAARWQVALLLPHPPVSLLYLFAVRQERLEPSFAPLVVLTALPVAALAIGGYAVARLDRRPAAWILSGVAVLELAWATIALMICGFGIAFRSG